MWIPFVIVTGLACLFAGIAYGYRNERDDAREQIRWLRGQRRFETPAPAPKPEPQPVEREEAARKYPALTS